MIAVTAHSCLYIIDIVVDIFAIVIDCCVLRSASIGREGVLKKEEEHLALSYCSQVFRYSKSQMVVTRCLSHINVIKL